MVDGMENITTPGGTSAVPDLFAQVDAHIEAIRPAHQEAWRGPVVRDYQPGALVWLWDHYNTATVEGPGRRPDSWVVTTTDAEGEISKYEYPSGQLRPAAAPVEFRRSEVA
jgi:hypothetical protein